MKLPYFVNLYKEEKHLVMVQWVYAALALGSLLIAGILALMNQSLGQSLLFIPAFAGIAFVANTIILSLAKTIVETLFPWINLETSENALKTAEKSAKKEKKTEKSLED